MKRPGPLVEFRPAPAGSPGFSGRADRDEINTNIAFTVRELNERVPIIDKADSPYSDDILRMAGSSKVLQIYDILGRSLAALGTPVVPDV